MSIIVVIPARFNSSRFPGKALYKIMDKALVHHVYDNVMLCSRVDECIVATDSGLIFDYCKLYGINVTMTSASHVNGTERVAEVAKLYNVKDVIINIQGDEPLVNKTQIDILIDMMLSDEAPAIASLGRTVIGEDISEPNVVKIVLDSNDYALYFSRAAVPFQRDINIEKKKQPFTQHIGMYAFKANVLVDLVKLPISNLERIESLEQLRWLENGYRIKIGYTDEILIGIDSLSDVDKLLTYWESKSL